MINKEVDTLSNTSIASQTKTEKAQYYDMLVFSSLRWTSSGQRTQHILSRMARSMKILFVEEPLQNSLDQSPGPRIVINQNLHILQPNVHCIAEIGAILPFYVKNKEITAGWFCSAGFYPVLESLQFNTIIYDYREDLSANENTGPELLKFEQDLTKKAAIIFTDRESLYHSKKELHNNVHYFPGFIDHSHFCKAQGNLCIPSDIGDLPVPIAGYYGDIDILDLELLAQTAAILPDVSFVLISPLAGIQQSLLPQGDNIHYLGVKCYKELPNYLKAFTIGMLPYKKNETAKYSSKSKMLELMAAKKSIITTAGIEIADNYPSCVRLASTADDFAAAVADLTDSTKNTQWGSRYEEMINETSWDCTVIKMKSIIKSTFTADYLSKSLLLIHKW